MKTYLLNTLPFIFAFLVVTGVIIYLNGQYNNIFQLDFSPRNQISQQRNNSHKVSENKNLPTKDDEQKQVSDSLSLPESTSDTVFTASLMEQKKISEKEIRPDLKELSKKELENQLEKKPNPEFEELEPKFASNNSDQFNSSKLQKQDSSYTNWLKKVSKLLEQMEPSKASKIIQNYSDNVARDIIYTMNKKSAAKIVSELSPEIAQRIIRYD